MVLSAAGSFELGLTNGQHPDSSRLDGAGKAIQTQGTAWEKVGMGSEVVAWSMDHNKKGHTCLEKPRAPAQLVPAPSSSSLFKCQRFNLLCKKWELNM